MAHFDPKLTQGMCEIPANPDLGNRDPKSGSNYISQRNGSLLTQCIFTQDFCTQVMTSSWVKFPPKEAVGSNKMTHLSGLKPNICLSRKKPDFEKTEERRLILRF